MLRMFGLSLVFLAGATTTAMADSRVGALVADAGARSALQQSAAVAGKAQRAAGQKRLVQLQIGGALALAQPALRASIVRTGPGVLAAAQESLRAPRPAPAAAPAMPWLSLGDGKSGLAYPVTDRLSLGLGYRYLRGEDLTFKVATTGSLDQDYDSHKVMLRARWKF